jgi:hypothetical protein
MTFETVTSLLKTSIASVLLGCCLQVVLVNQSFAQIDPNSEDLPISKQAPKMPPAMERPNSDTGLKGTIKLSRVFFVYPKDGDTISRKTTMKFGVEGLDVLKAGEIEPGAGHFHVLIDVPTTPKGDVIPMDKNHLHFQEGQKEAKIKLKKGEHTLTLLFGDGQHRSYGEMMSQTIKVNVK